MQVIPFAGSQFTGSVELGARGISVFAVPSDPAAESGMASVTFDPTPEQRRAIATALAIMAEEMGYEAAQLALPGLEHQAFYAPSKEQSMNKQENASER